MKPFVKISTDFFIGIRFVNVSVTVKTENAAVFICHLQNFCKRLHFDDANPDFPITFNFDFMDNPDVFLNRVRFSGIKPEIEIITFSKFLFKVLSKTM